MSEKIRWSKPCDPNSWDADIGEPIATFDSPEQAQNAARLANQGKLVFIKLWKLLTGDSDE